MSRQGHRYEPAGELKHFLQRDDGDLFLPIRICNQGFVSIKGEQFTSCTTDFGERKLNAPRFQSGAYGVKGRSYQISRLLRRPYSPASFNSASNRAASKGLQRNISIEHNAGGMKWNYRRGTAYVFLVMTGTDLVTTLVPDLTSDRPGDSSHKAPWKIWGLWTLVLIKTHGVCHTEESLGWWYFLLSHESNPFRKRSNSLFFCHYPQILSKFSVQNNPNYSTYHLTLASSRFSQTWHWLVFILRWQTSYDNQFKNIWIHVTVFSVTSLHVVEYVRLQDEGVSGHKV